MSELEHICPCPLIPTSRGAKLSPSSYILLFHFYELHQGIWPTAGDYLSQNPLCVGLCDQVWDNRIEVDVIYGILGSRPYR